MRLRDWIGESMANRRYFENIRNIWEASERKINTERIDLARVLNRVLVKISKPGLTERIYGQWKRIGAVVSILVAAGA